MNEFLKNLEIGGNKLPDDIVKSILAEHGKYIAKETTKVEDKYKTEVEEYKTTINSLKEEVEKAPKTEDFESLKSKIADYEKAENERIEAVKKAEKEAKLDATIQEAIKDKQFVNDRTKNAIVNEIKEALSKDDNIGKSANEIFESITKDATDIFVNPNKVPDMAPMGDTDATGKKDIPLIW